MKLIDMTPGLARLAAWGLALVVVASTFSPVDYRPHVESFSPQIERFGAFFALTSLMLLGYPRSWRKVAIAAAAAAVLLEAAQQLVPDRHALPVDALAKLAGVVAAVICNRLALAMLPQREPAS